jgi:hypothetical protein
MNIISSKMDHVPYQALNTQGLTTRLLESTESRSFLFHFTSSSGNLISPVKAEAIYGALNVEPIGPTLMLE